MDFLDSYAPNNGEAGPVLMTGDRFTTKTDKRGVVEYEFVGCMMFCLDDTFLVIRDLSDGKYRAVDYNWFRKEFGQKIIRVRRKKRGGKDNGKKKSTVQ